MNQIGITQGLRKSNWGQIKLVPFQPVPKKTKMPKNGRPQKCIELEEY